MGRHLMDRTSALYSCALRSCVKGAERPMGEHQERRGRAYQTRLAGAGTPESQVVSLSGSPESSLTRGTVILPPSTGTYRVEDAYGEVQELQASMQLRESVQDQTTSVFTPRPMSEEVRDEDNDDYHVASKTDLEEVMEEPDGLDDSSAWGDFPIDKVSIRSEPRTVQDIIRRIDEGRYIMNPEFQREFVWPEDKQSKLIESAVMRIPLPVIYLAENDDGMLVVVDGLQRLMTFHNFVKGKFSLILPDREDLHKKKFDDLIPKYQNRIEDCSLRVYIIDSSVPERARLDIFERVNGGVPLTRQQMRNCMFMGQATQFLKEESTSQEFKDATGNRLNSKTMRDREFINRFCAFRTLGVEKYAGDMDLYLANCLRVMNKMDRKIELDTLSRELRIGLRNSYLLFREQTFRKHKPGQERRSVINAALWDVMSTEFSQLDEEMVTRKQDRIREVLFDLFANEQFNDAISRSTGNVVQVKTRFELMRMAIMEIQND